MTFFTGPSDGEQAALGRTLPVSYLDRVIHYGTARYQYGASKRLWRPDTLSPCVSCVGRGQLWSVVGRWWGSSLTGSSTACALRSCPRRYPHRDQKLLPVFSFPVLALVRCSLRSASRPHHLVQSKDSVLPALHGQGVDPQ